ncbi:MAG: hypothetical protein Q7U54_10445 [Bacteroidales bacterium]|nr:hypothetical protein [Bacteroidales bacterium]
MGLDVNNAVRRIRARDGESLVGGRALENVQYCKPASFHDDTAITGTDSSGINRSKPIKVLPVLMGK